MTNTVSGSYATRNIMQNAPSPALIAAYQAAFDHFNQTLFGDKLRHVVLNFSRHAKARGFFAPERWGTGAEDETRTSEISLNPTFLSQRPLIETYSTLVHEMVHAWEHQNGRPCRRNYHGKSWADAMESRGLMPSSTGEPGGNRTGDRMTHYIVPDGLYTRAFDSLPDAAQLPLVCVDQLDAKAKRARNKIKYTCGTCGTNVWGKPELAITCQTCEVEFEPEEQEDET